MAPQVEGDKMHTGTKRGHTYEKYDLILLKGHGADPPTKPWGRTFSVKSRSFHSGSESPGSSPQPGAWRVVSARHVCGYLPPLNVA